MLSLISFILVIVGCVNWLSIGILQYDFVAGMFGSQANIFSRIVYALVGIASIVVAFNLVKNKGKFAITFKKNDKEYEYYLENTMALNNAESGKDNYDKEPQHECKCKNGDCKNKDTDIK